MSREAIALIIVLGTFAFALVLAAIVSLHDPDKENSSSTWMMIDATGVTVIISSVVRATQGLFAEDSNTRMAAGLFWSGLACGGGAAAVYWLA